MIQSLPYNTLGCIAVMRNLDPSDLLEAQLTRGASIDHLDLFADWHGMQANCVLSLVITTGRAAGATPFAVLALGNTGQAGVAQAAFLARDHKRYRRFIAQSAIAICERMPLFAREAGIHRIEARAWADHPTASRFLTAIGFHHECDMPGFGASGRVTFRQFAWLADQPPVQQKTPTP